MAAGTWKVYFEVELAAASRFTFRIQHVLTASSSTRPAPRSTVTRTAKLSTVPYAYEAGLITRLLGVALEAVNAYGVRLLRI